MLTGRARVTELQVWSGGSDYEVRAANPETAQAACWRKFPIGECPARMWPNDGTVRYAVSA